MLLLEVQAMDAVRVVVGVVHPWCLLPSLQRPLPLYRVPRRRHRLLRKCEGRHLCMQVTL